MKPPIRAGIGLALIFCAAQALAAAYDDFNAGVAQLSRGDNEAAVAAFTRALDAGDLGPGLVPTAYFDRALAYFRLEQADLGLADITSAIAKKPDYIEAYLVRGHFYAREGNAKEAEADFDSAIRLRPDRSDLYFARGRSRWDMGDFADAATDFGQASRLNAQEPYSIVWQFISAGRATPMDQDALRNAVHGLDLYRWPGPVLRLFLRRLSPEELQAAATHADAIYTANPVCEANFYIAEWHVLNNELAEAKPLLEAAAKDCSRNNDEFYAAAIELKRAPFR